MEQQTKDWHSWRRQGLGSSDAPVIMGVSPYRTPYELWEEKTGKTERDENQNWAQARGSNLEPIARATYEMMHEMDMPPMLAEHQRFPFLRASLDGFNQKLRRGLEIKCVGKEKHEMALSGKVPEEFIPQLDHQILVTDALVIDYYSFDGTKGVRVEHFPNVDRIKLLLSAELDFWKCVEFDEAPALCDRDYKKIKNKEMTQAATAWKKAKKRLDEVSAKESELKKRLIQFCEHPRMRGAGIKIQKVWRIGSVDYSKIPELKDVNLDSFRKESTSSWRIEAEKEKK